MKKQLLTLLIALPILGFSQTTFEAFKVIDPNTTDRPYELEAGDLDGDGDMDIVMATNTNPDNLDNTIRWYENDGDGNFTIKTDVSSTIKWVDGLEVADIDGQFGLDIIASSANQGKLVYFLSDGTGGFGSEVVIDGTLVGGPGEVVAGDINMDGNIDVTVAVFDNKVAWYSGDGAGNFTAETDVQSGTNNPFYMDMADYDGDTDLDIVVGFFTGQSIEVYYNQYIESGSTAVSWVKDTETVDSGDSFLLNVEFGDVNNDGDMDIVKVDQSSGDVQWYDKEKDMVATVNDISDASIIARPAEVVIADIDGDTFNDVILTDFASGDDAIIWFKGANNANPSATPTTITDNNFQMVALAVADYDDDTDLDIASVGLFNDTVFWLENELIDLSIGENEDRQVSIYPNPVVNELHFKNLSQSTQVSIVDVLGKEVLRSEVSDSKALDVSFLNSGFYTMHIADSNSVIKLLKK